MEKPSAHGPSPSRKAHRVLGSRLNRRPSVRHPCRHREIPPTHGARKIGKATPCIRVWKVSPQKPRKHFHVNRSTWSPSLRSCEFFERCPTQRSASLQRVMAGALYVGSVDGNSNSIIT